jgi:MFS transporter, NNP family, nitrate/nitrite transporter
MSEATMSTSECKSTTDVFPQEEISLTRVSSKRSGGDIAEQEEDQKQRSTEIAVDSTPHTARGIRMDVDERSGLMNASLRSTRSSRNKIQSEVPVNASCLPGDGWSSSRLEDMSAVNQPLSCTASRETVGVGDKERSADAAAMSQHSEQSSVGSLGSNSSSVSDGISEESLDRVHHESLEEETTTPRYTIEGALDSKYREYDIVVDPEQDDRATDIPLYSMKRPHMRGFHLAWTCFFVAFFTWFAITPLLSEIAFSLDLTHDEIWTSSVLAVLSSAVTRVWMGPLNDTYGARWMMCTTLVAAAIPTALAGLLLKSARSLNLIRLFIGVAGGAFVTCQYWTLSMFTREIAGTANSLAAGWGNLGGAVAQLVMGTILFPLFKLMYEESRTTDRASELAWRTILAFPAIPCFIMAYVAVRYGDDTPKGNVSDQRSSHQHPFSTIATIWANFLQGASNRNSLLLSFQYGCCFGVEITMTQGAALYFAEEFGQSTASAAAIASIFGWMNLFARGIGGFCSDMANARSGLRGRLWLQVCMLAVEGSLVIVFAHTRTLGTMTSYDLVRQRRFCLTLQAAFSLLSGGAIVVMVVFSIFVQAAAGSTFGIVSYVDAVTGSVAGVVAAGGNVGGACFAYLLVHHDYRTSFKWMGIIVVASAVLTSFIAIPGHRCLLTGRDSAEVVQHRRQAKLPAVIIVDADNSKDGEDSLSEIHDPL